MQLPEMLEDSGEVDDRGVEGDLYDLGMSGEACADLLVGRVRYGPAHVAGGHGADALDLFEDSLDAPEAAGPQCSDLAARGSGGRIGLRGFGRRRFGILFGFRFTGNFFFGLFHCLFFNQAGIYPVCAGAENQRQDTEAEQAKAVFQGNGIHISTGNDKKQS